MWWTVRNSSTISTNSAHTARRPYGTTSIGFTSPYGFVLRPLVHGSPKFAPHCLLNNMRQADIVASLGTHMNLGNPIEVVPLRATTGLCGGAFHSATSSLVTIHANAKVSQRRNFCVFDFALFTNSDFCDFDLFNFRLLQFLKIERSPFLNFQNFCIVQCNGATLIVAGDDPCERTTGHKPAWRA